MNYTYVLLSEKKWHINLFSAIKFDPLLSDFTWYLIDNRDDFKFDNLVRLNPHKIFIPHWSYLIDEKVFNSFECIVFHMTDLPFGRGGSPLQNLIVRGFTETKITAIKVSNGIDTGDIYLKENLSLLGTADEIFVRASTIIYEMIKKIIVNNISPYPQQGEYITFKRRKPSESNIANLQSIVEIYDYIRMMDAEGYPNAFLEIGEFRYEFSRASIKNGEIIIADVRIFKK